MSTQIASLIRSDDMRVPGEHPQYIHGVRQAANWLILFNARYTEKPTTRQACLREFNDILKLVHVALSINSKDRLPTTRPRRHLTLQGELSRLAQTLSRRPAGHIINAGRSA